MKPLGRIGPALPPPPLVKGEPPLAILVDYDGTIARTDVSDSIMAEFVTADWEEATARYDAGLVGSRRLMEWEVGLITTPFESLAEVAAAQPHDPTFAAFVAAARSVGVPVEVVSDGFGFFIPGALDALGVGELPVVTADTHVGVDGRPVIEFPNGHPLCFVCGTCKRARVRGWQASGRAVAFIGDGASDRYAAGYANAVFAKDALVQLCIENGWPFQRWTEFAEVERWLVETIETWRSDPASATMPRADLKPFFCGPEIWGDGRFDPLPPERRATDVVPER